MTQDGCSRVQTNGIVINTEGECEKQQHRSPIIPNRMDSREEVTPASIMTLVAIIGKNRCGCFLVDTLLRQVPSCNNVIVNRESSACPLPLVLILPRTSSMIALRD